MRRTDRGTAMVEFAFVGVLLVMLAFGIIVFGFLLSFKQDVTRAAAEGARAGAVAVHTGTEPTTQSADQRHAAASAATEEAVNGFEKSCTDGSTDCYVTVHDCGVDPDPLNPPAPASYFGNPTQDCVTVEIVYDYANFPLIIDPPLLSSVLPDEIRSKSVARLNS